MSYPSLAVAVVMQSTTLANRWQSVKWEPVEVVADESEPGSGPRSIMENGGCTRWLYPGFSLELFHDEAEGYYLNLHSPQPYVFVNWLEDDGKGAPQLVTVSYNEAARQMDGGATVDGVPMPAEWVPWLEQYVRKHYKPEAKKKRIRPPSFKGAQRDGP
jgi:hypothetical protein